MRYRITYWYDSEYQDTLYFEAGTPEEAEKKADYEMKRRGIKEHDAFLEQVQ